jgi:hypothetical protein
LFAKDSCRGRKATAFFEHYTVYYADDEFNTGDGYSITMDQAKSMSVPPNTAIRAKLADGNVEYLSNGSSYPICLSFSMSPYNSVGDEDENPVIAFDLVDPDVVVNEP